MASPISKADTDEVWQGRVLSHDDFASRLDAQRKMLMMGTPDMPRTAGNRRTTSKQALLEALSRLGASW